MSWLEIIMKWIDDWAYSYLMTKPGDLLSFKLKKERFFR